MVLSLAFALIGVAMVVRSVQLLELTKADMARARFEKAMDGAHLAAAAAVVRSGRSGAFAWPMGTDLGEVLVTAEPEADKLSLEAASQLEDEVFAALGVTRPAELKGTLARLSADGARVSIADLDVSIAWRDCAPSIISSFGDAEQVRYEPRIAPEAGMLTPAWHIGETWRIRVATTAGWRDERIVRFTGDARHPAATVLRRLSRIGAMGGQCDTLLNGLFGV